MIIHWFGQGCVRIKAKEATIVVDPFNKGFGLAVPRLKADILGITHDHEDHNNAAAVAGEPFVIRNPGEYHLKDVFVRGVQGFHDARQGRDRGLVTLLTMTLESLNVAHLSDIGQSELTPYQLEALGTVDVLMIPVGGVYTVDAKGASHLVNQIEPKVVIPIHYDLPGLSFKGKTKILNGAAPFLVELGVKTAPVKEAKITPASLPAEGMSVIVLEPATE